MKLLSSLLLVVAGTCSSLAAVSVNWLTPSNSIKQADGTTNAPNTWMAQLIWSPDNVPSALDSNNPFVPTGGEVVMSARQMGTSVAGRVIAGKTTLSGTDATLITGFVYTRVFNVDFNGGSPGTPTFYGNSSVITGGLQIETIDAATIVNHWNSPTGVGLVVNQAVAVVPEPSTYAFLGVGAMVFGLRRFRARR
jgi:PEP-CTERM motif